MHNSFLALHELLINNIRLPVRTTADHTLFHIDSENNLQKFNASKIIINTLSM